MSDIKKYVLDTSALLTYYQDEAGADLIEEVFVQASSGKAIVYISFMSIFEIAYLAMSRENLDEATKLVLQLRELPLEEVWPDEELLWLAAQIKAKGGLSVADAFIAGLARKKAATLVHRDPEFSRVDLEIDQLMLPAKNIPNSQ
ncbi:type II toxin-antitoxin system VapC family toxin [Desulfofundulus thermosubterraneus]|uniref:Ribonuclease VapC n=1 Tax=Desulfofundulus thermosubterraneus DSM 16057 TaxID=1121432 RepID=A0A1M6AQI5_9FIRM|nr:type II toxin-antitoxin system VapC family toxin [Desulfofundulus thermosubterraneus]SHI38760.1 Predicted nucleic acid-binding protein, contains PIN domain [Desulfofundulus thermosubterraneus DSM 16057]